MEIFAVVAAAGLRLVLDGLGRFGKHVVPARTGVVRDCILYLGRAPRLFSYSTMSCANHHFDILVSTTTSTQVR